MKTLFKIFALSLILAMGATPIALGVQSKKLVFAQDISATLTEEISPRSTTYLLSPTLAAQSESTTFVFDSETKEIKAIENSQIVLASYQSQTPLAMQFVLNHLFVLTQSKIACLRLNSGENPTLSPIKIVTEQAGNPTDADFSFAGTFSTFYILQEQPNTLSLFVQLSGSNNIEIHKYILTYHSAEDVFSATTSSVFNSSTLSIESQNTTNPIKSFVATATESGYNFAISDGSSIYQATATSQLATCNVVTNQPCKSICVLGDSYVCAMQNTIEFYNASDFSYQESNSISFSANHLCSQQNMLVALQTHEQKVVQILPELSTIFQNTEVLPTINATLLFGTATSPQTLLPQPYSTQSQGQPIATGQSLIILSQNQTGYEGYSYVTFAHGNENYYGFIATEQITPKQVTNSNTKATITVSCNLYRLPSNIADQTNTIVKSLNKGEKITITNNAANIQNNGKEFAYAQTQDGSYGYVEISKTTQSSNDSQIKKTTTNASTNKDATIYATASNEQPITTLAKGSRIKIYGLLNPTAKYTRITAEDEFGNIQTGYMLTSSITSDNITTLQLTGIILLVTSAILLSALIAFTIAAHKRQNKSAK